LDDHLPNILAKYVAEPATSGLHPLVEARGSRTAEDPLQLILVLRHPDIADEADTAEAYTQATQLLSVLDAALAALSPYPETSILEKISWAQARWMKAT
jgi:hypothetical protein